MSGVLYIAHCIDTEGPLRETLGQTFERLNKIFGLQLEASEELLGAIQRQEVDLGGVEAAAAQVVRRDLLAYNETWADVDAMLDRICSIEYRERFCDDDGRGWVYNWFCGDHVGHVVNPRARAEGLHAIFDHYRDRFGEHGDDGLHFHFHPEALNRRANSNATHWFANTPKLFEILASRVIDRHWFPSVNRPGFHTERPDSHWFLEQFIPFDFANQAMRAGDGGEQPDLAAGRFGDWRRAPVNWSPYRPAHDDYQSPGACRRSIFRCLNVGTRFRCLARADVEDAFELAQRDGTAVLAFTDHDFRDIGRDVAAVWDLIQDVRKRWPGVRVCNEEARQAARRGLGLDVEPAPDLTVRFEDGRLHVESAAPIFGPQPFLAIGARDGRRLHDSLDIHEPFRRWSYTLDDQTLTPDLVESVGLAAAAPSGAVRVVVCDMGTGNVTQTTC